MPAQFVYGWNRPGFMPDFVSEEAMDWNEAREALLWEVERWDEQDDMTSAQLDKAAAWLRNDHLTPHAGIEVECGAYVLFVQEA